MVSLIKQYIWATVALGVTFKDLRVRMQIEKHPYKFIFYVRQQGNVLHFKDILLNFLQNSIYFIIFFVQIIQFL
jgi:hypothetical protein